MATPEARQAAQQQRIQEAADRAVAAAPPLTARQINRLAALFGPYVPDTRQAGAA